ncbi:thioredoxin-like protein [Roridomyces roridus]|uniref:glutathione transferase n=1 Tax=Roridomyces roridus TaxID=1738132 RepID=A0AAD7FPY0_9AGAR|nr:thioredoxin-like protein [Roridomyces roridus]
MVLKVYGLGVAVCTRRIATVLHELQIPFELVEVNLMAGEHKTPEFLEKNPFGQISYIDDDGFILYESRAICRYLATKYKSQLLPAAGDLQAKAIFEQACASEYCSFDPEAAKYVLETVLKPSLYGTTPDTAEATKILEALEPKIAAYDTILKKSRYVAGEKLTLADLFHLPIAPLLAVGGSDVMTSQRFQNVKHWYEELVGRASWKAYEGGVKTTLAY